MKVIKELAMLNSYPYSSLQDGVLWDAVRHREYSIKDVRKHAGTVRTTIADGPAAGLILELYWIPSSLEYGPHFEIAWVCSDIPTRTAWKRHFERVEAFCK